MRITTNYMLLASVLTAGALATACSEEKFQETPDRDEIYAREFIKEFGTPDPDHDWTMATTAELRVNAPDPVSLQVYAEIDGKLYIFADIPGYKGENAVPVTIPKGTEELIVVADGTEYRCSPSATLDLSTAQPINRKSQPFTTSISSENNIRGSRLNLETQSTTDDDKYAIINLAENPEIYNIINAPFNSKYLCRYDDGLHCILGTPFMSNSSYHYWGAMSTSDQFEAFPLYASVPMGINICQNDYDGVSPDVESRLFDSYDFLTSNNGIDYEFNGGRDVDMSTFIKTPSADIWESLPNSKKSSDFSYSTLSSSGTSYSYSRYNYHKWDKQFYDAKLKDMNTCYCACVLFHKVPITWTHHGKTESALVEILGLYRAPSYPAANRTEKPEAYIIEWHGYGSTWWGFDFYEKNEAQPYKWRLFAEDLGGSHDWDFNDLVIEYTDILSRYEPEIDHEDFVWNDELWCYTKYIDGKIEEVGFPPAYSQLYPKFTDTKLDEDMMVRKITVTPLAAGGTLPIYFAFHGKLSGKHPVDPDMLLSDYMNNHQSPVYHEGDFVIGCEMHKWLGGSSHHTPLNVGETKTHSGKEVTFYTTADLPNPNDRNHTLNSLNLNNFRVLVDPDNTLGASLGDAIDGNADIKSVDINAWNGGYVVNKPSLTDESKTPQVLIANINSPWTKEGKNFGEAYPYFGDWIRDPNSVPLWTVKRRVEELLVKE